MIKSKILLLILLMLPFAVRAYDFSVTVASGQTLYFNYVTGGVEVVYPNATSIVAQGWNGYVMPTGAMTVPSSVSDGSATYAVVSVANYAFHSCSDLSAVNLAAGVATVGNGAFYNCSGIATLTLPATVTSIGNAAFAGCTSLADVWMGDTVPPVTSTSAFYGLDLSLCTLHVACGSSAAYSAAVPWSSFGTVVQVNCMVTIAAMANHSSRGTVLGAGTYATGTLVTLVAQPASGYCFVCWHDGDTLNPRLVNAMSDSAFTAMFFALQRDTVYLADGDTVTLHDTIHHTDTVYLAVTLHDTTYLHDTLYVDLPVHDTLVQHDTVLPTFYTLGVVSDQPSLGVGVGSAVLPAGSVVEVCGLPLEGVRFAGWSDGVGDNPRQVTITANLTLHALFELQSLASVEQTPWNATVNGRYLTVDGVAGRTVSLYDSTGRRLLSQSTAANTLTLTLPATGVYLLQVDGGAARKIVITDL